MKKINLIVIALWVGLSAGSVSAFHVSTNALPERARYWAGMTMSKIKPEMQVSDVEDIVRGSVRSLAYVSVGLLLRNNAGDCELANSILEKLLQVQLTDPADRYSYGSWKKNTKNNDKTDENWREFVGIALITALEVFPEKISEQNKADMKSALIRAGEGAKWRDQSVDYSNIAIMSALLMEYAGKIGDREDIYNRGHKKAKDVYDLYKKHNSLSEFNSPTYAGVCLTGFGLWKSFSPSQETKDIGAELQELLWEEIADFYNPNLQNFCGPYFRGYGMDVQKCNALVGIWIEMATDRPGPIAGMDALKAFELDSFSLSAIVYTPPSPQVLEKLLKIDAPRFVKEDVFNKYEGKEIKKVTAFITPNWMMGGSTGHRRDWNQICPGTIHWKDPESKFVNWILVPSRCKTDIVVNETEMQILPSAHSGKKLILIVYASLLESNQFENAQWKLPGMDFNIKTKMAGPTVRPLSSKEQEKYLTSDVQDTAWIVEYTEGAEEPVGAEKPVASEPWLSIVPVQGPSCEVKP